MIKIVVLDGYTENPGDLSWAGFERFGELTVYDRTEPKDAAARIKGAQIVLTNKTPVTEETLKQCPFVRYIGVLATGFNIVDTEAAARRGVTVTNIPSYGTHAVAQFAIALLLEICHRVGHHSQAVRDGRWTACADFCFWDYPQMELSGKKLGVVGFGRIGRAVGRIAHALGMDVIAYDTNMDKGEDYNFRYAGLEELFSQSDVITLHCPLTPQTQGLINKSTISSMKDDVIIINNSRGPLIVEQDLADALNCSKVYAAGLDVAGHEPIRADNPLLTAKNCFITPHISWAARESRERLMQIAVDNLAAFLSERPMNVVNRPVIK